MTIESIIISFLVDQNLPGIGDRVFAERPEDSEKPYVLVSRSGGSERDFIKSYLIHTEVCVKRDPERGKTKALCLEIHESLVEAMKHITDTTQLYHCGKNSDYDATRTDAKEYRYQALWDITM